MAPEHLLLELQELDHQAGQRLIGRRLCLDVLWGEEGTEKQVLNRKVGEENRKDGTRKLNQQKRVWTRVIAVF